MPETSTFELAGGRTLEYLDLGPAGAPVLVFHHGTPSAALPYGPLTEAAAGAGLRLVTYSRPGYGDSSPRPGRSVASAAGDVADLLDHLDAGRFVTAGWSGGGPHALATAAGLGRRCAAVAGIAVVGPHAAEGLDFLDGMGEDNLHEFGAAIEGAEVLEAFLDRAVDALSSIEVDEIATAMSSLLPPADLAALRSGMGEYLAGSFHRALAGGIAGWRDDDLAFVRPWGFDLRSVEVPAGLWQGGTDLMVPAAHGQWLAAHVPGAELHALADEGHLSLLGRAGEIVSSLASHL